MRPVKHVGLAMMTALIAGWAVTPSAMATNSTGICTLSSESLACPTGYLTWSVRATAVNPLLHTSMVNVKCESSVLKADLLALGNPQVAHLEELTWTGCKTHGGTNCTVTTLLMGLFNLLKLSSSDAHVKSTGGTVVEVECGVFLDCAYGGEPTLLGLSAWQPFYFGLLHANTSLTENAWHSDAFCPASSTFLATYETLFAEYIRS